MCVHKTCVDKKMNLLLLVQSWFKISTDSKKYFCKCFRFYTQQDFTTKKPNVLHLVQNIHRFKKLFFRSFKKAKRVS